MKAKVLRREEQLGGGENGETPMDVDQEALGDDEETGTHPGRGGRKKTVGSSEQHSRI